MKLYTVSTGDIAYRYEKALYYFLKAPEKFSVHRYLMVAITKIFRLFLTMMAK